MEAHAHELRGELEGRLAAVRAAVSEAPSPRVVALERLDAPRVGGYWIPEMISIAGGVDVAGDPGLQPPEVGWGELASLRPEVVDRDAGRLARRRPRAGDGALGADRRARRRPRSSPSTPTPPSPTPARAWSTASSCSPTCSTPRWSHRRAAGFEALHAPRPQPLRAGCPRAAGSGGGEAAERSERTAIATISRQLDREAVAPVHPALAGDDREGAEGAADQAADVGADADVGDR